MNTEVELWQNKTDGLPPFGDSVRLRHSTNPAQYTLRYVHSKRRDYLNDSAFFIKNYYSVQHFM